MKTRRHARLFAAAALFAALFAAPGCEPSIRTQGAAAVRASYSYPSLETDLPDASRAPAVIAAAESTMRARGYSITKSIATEEGGTVAGLPPRSSDYPNVEIVATRTTTGTHVKISITPFGDEELSRSLLDGILTRLGL